MIPDPSSGWGIGFESIHGAPDRSRTCNPQIRSLVLYPLSYGRIERLCGIGFHASCSCRKSRGWEVMSAAYSRQRLYRALGLWVKGGSVFTRWVYSLLMSAGSHFRYYRTR
jgi:hypothetical protein